MADRHQRGKIVHGRQKKQKQKAENDDSSSLSVASVLSRLHAIKAESVIRRVAFPQCTANTVPNPSVTNLVIAHP